MTVLALAVVAALLGGAVCFAVAAPGRRAALPSRFLVAALIGLVVGELVSMLALSGSIDERLRDDADRAAVSAPAVRSAQEGLDGAVAARSSLDGAVDEAAARRDQALVVARCEYRPGPACPQTSITGVPGQGAETRTANQRLAAAQTDLDRATAARATRAPAADAAVVTARADVAAAHDEAVAGADRGVGARWVALNRVTAASLPAAALRIGIDLVCVVLALLPLLLRLWRGETARDIRSRQRLESERLAAAAQLAIDRRAQERHVELATVDRTTVQLPPALAPVAALEAAGFEPVAMTARRYVRELPPERPTPADDFLPIAAAAEAASFGAPASAPLRARPEPIWQSAADEAPTGPLRLPSDEDHHDQGIEASAPAPNHDSHPAEEATVPDETNLPVPAASEPMRQGRETALSASEPERRPNPFVPPVLDDAARLAARFVRPLVPPIVARVLTPGTRTVQQSYEEVEEVTFSMRRTRKVTVGVTEQVSAPTAEPGFDGARPAPHRATAQVGRTDEPLDVAYEVGPADLAREVGAPERNSLPPQSGPRHLPPAP